LAGVQEEEVPEDVVAFLKKDDPQKDDSHFWRLLREWYLDEASGTWHADWAGFHFPGDADFSEATFSGDADFSGATFSGYASFMATFSAAADFSEATFSGDATFFTATFSGDATFFMATFSGAATFIEATFSGDADFSARFSGAADFSGATFSGGADFPRATFSGYASFTATFSGDADFSRATFSGYASFIGATFSGHADFIQETFSGDADFSEATFSGDADFSGATFSGDADFSGATFSGDTRFVQTVVETYLRLGVRPTSGGSLVIDRVGAARGEETGLWPPTVIDFGAMSLARVELRSLDASKLRFRAAFDLERAVFVDVKWPREDDREDRRPLLPEEADLERLSKEDRKSQAIEVERIYRGIRRNFEDHGARVAAHDWYFSEMEVGKHYAPRLLTRLARRFYKATSNYGLSALRPLVVLAIAILIALSLFSVPNDQICPVKGVAATGSVSCVGWADRMEVVLLAIFLQSPPDGVSLPGPLSVLLWLLLRVTGAATLVSLAVAFRNQVAR
jgi:uncharacterized protein YjbI with pentapeptide repeats